MNSGQGTKAVSARILAAFVVGAAMFSSGCRPYTPPPGNPGAHKSARLSAPSTLPETRDSASVDDAPSRRVGIQTPVPNPYFRTNTVNVTSRRRQAILHKLKTITIEEIHFDEIPLPEVMRYLNAETKRLDADKQGVNFLLLSPAATDGVSVQVGGGNENPVPDPFGQTEPVPAGEALVTQSVDLKSVVIDIDPPLRDMPLVYALDAIAKKADYPIQFAVTDYAVVVWPKSPGQTDRFFRSFRASGDLFQQGLEGVQGIPINGLGSSR